MRLQPRYYQREGVDALLSFLDTTGPDRSGIIAMPTGTGKALVIAMACEILLSRYPWLRIEIPTHVKELVAQNHAELLELWPLAPAGIYSAGLKRKDRGYPITFCNIQSIASTDADFVNLALVDEGHLISPKQASNYQKYFASRRAVNPNFRYACLTATAYRMGMGLLTEGGLFTDMVYDITGYAAFNRLVDEGFLAPLTSKRTALQFDPSSCRTVGGDYNEHDLQALVDDDRKTRAAVNEVLHYGRDRHAWLFFCAGNHHAERTAAILREAGIPAGCVHSKSEDRDETIRAFKEGRLRALTNNNILTTGFNYPLIDLEVWLRPTKSTSLWVQGLGRGTRPVLADGMPRSSPQERAAAIAAGPKPHGCLVLDFVGNTRRIGPINDPIIPRPRGKGGGTAPVRLCEICGTYNHASKRNCEECGAEMPRVESWERIEGTAGSEDPMRRSQPEEQLFDVARVEYLPHISRDPNKPPSMRVIYHCGLRTFSEWVCVAHPTGTAAHNMAIKWWTTRVRVQLNNDSIIAEPPDKLDAAVTAAPTLPMPKRLRVWINKHPYPEILGHEFE